MDERLLEQLQEMEQELEALQGALEAIEKSKEVTKESSKAIKKSQEALSQACENFIPELQEKFANFASDSTSVQHKIEELLSKLENLDIHEFAKKLDDSSKYIEQEVGTKLDSQSESIDATKNDIVTKLDVQNKAIISAISEAKSSFNEVAENTVQALSRDKLDPLNQKLELIRDNLAAIRETLERSLAEEITANITAQHEGVIGTIIKAEDSISRSSENAIQSLIADKLDPLSQQIQSTEHSIVELQEASHVSLEALFADQKQQITAIAERVTAVENDVTKTKAIVKQVQIIGIAVAILCVASLGVSLAKFFI